MATLGRESTVYMALVLLAVFVSTSTGQWIGNRCAWDQYYDENVDNCAPCSEICDSMTVSDTEHQCKTQCSDYLVSRSCQWDEYFDEIVKSCAPCSELCSQRDTAKGATKNCSRKCGKYLAENSRSQAPPANGKTGSGGADDDDTPSSSSSWVPGIVATAAVGVIAITALTGLVFRHYRTRQPANRPRTDFAGTPTGDALIPVETDHLAPPTQVSSEADSLADINISDQRLTSSPPEGASAQPESVELGIPECDPVAPSSAAYWYVCRQQPS